MCHRARGRAARSSIDHGPPPQCGAPPRNSCGDSGFSLVETIISIALAGIVVVGTLSAVTTALTASSTSRSAANVETSLVNAADRVNRAPKRCDYSIYAQAAVQTQGWDPSTVSVSQQYYLPGVDPTAAGTWLTGPAASTGCAGSTPTELLVQRVAISITSPNGQVTRTIEVVKSDV